MLVDSGERDRRRERAGSIWELLEEDILREWVSDVRRSRKVWRDCMENREGKRDVGGLASMGLSLNCDMTSLWRISLRRLVEECLPV